MSEEKTSLTKKKEVKAHGGTVLQYEHLSTSTKTKMVFSVFLPSVSSTKKVPAIYYLSGLTCTDQNFITKATPYEAASAYGVAIIAPDTSPRDAGIKGEDDNWDFGTGAGFYVDATEDTWKSNYNMHTYVTQELPALIEKELPITSKKSIFGHSMGGHGALICYLKNPDMYESCSAFSPICNPIQCPWGEKAFTGYLGTNKQTWEAYDATCLVGNYVGSKYEILIDQGTKDKWLEQKQLLPKNFVQACRAAKFPVNLRMQEGYDHSYFFIRTFLEDHIKHHAEALDKAFIKDQVPMYGASSAAKPIVPMYGTISAAKPNSSNPEIHPQLKNYLPKMAPINVPMKRRTQTLALVLWNFIPWCCIFLSLWLIRSGWLITMLFLLYVTWMLTVQEFHINGGHRQQWLRRSIFWRQFRDYFPITLIRTVKLDPKKNYLFGYHPHGIIAFGAFCNFATEATDFEGKFPGINLRLLTLRTNFYMPLYGLYLTCLGLCDASRESLNNIFSKGPGHSAMLVLGGAKESLDAHPGTFNLTLKNRKGFVKVAIQNGASLVPVFSFGENDVFEQVANPRGSRLRKIQGMLQKKLGFALPLIKGRGIFNYSFGLLPHRKPITTIVGTPIDVPKLPREEITRDMVNEYHAKYMDGLRAIWDAYKDTYAFDRKGSLIYVDH